jgi:hypothetical protein
MHAVIETESFAKSVKAQGLTENEHFEIVQAIALNPSIGDLIKGTGGARKVRFGGKGKGKSSAYRVVTYFAADDVPVFLLEFYAKNEKINLSKAECNELKKILSGIADDYRRSTRSRISKIKEKQT